MTTRRSFSPDNERLAKKYSQMLADAGISDRQEAIKFLEKRFPTWRTYLTIFADPSNTDEFILVGRSY